MATIPIMTKLEDAQALHAEFPDTFQAPDAHELATINPGDFVKVCRCRERFWLRVIGASGRYLIGEVDAMTVEPENRHLTLGKRVKFETRHVYTIMTPPKGMPR
jgi:hypothetical protein